MVARFFRRAFDPAPSRLRVGACALRSDDGHLGAGGGVPLRPGPGGAHGGDGGHRGGGQEWGAHQGRPGPGGGFGGFGVGLWGLEVGWAGG